MMKHPLIITILIPCCLILMGCPYKSKNPVDDTQRQERSEFCGTWTDFQAPEKKYTVSYLKNGKYHVLESAMKSEGEEVKKLYYGTISVVGREQFLNLEDTSQKEPGFYMYKILYLNSTKLVLLPLSGKWMPDLDQKGQLKAWLVKFKDVANFYEQDDLGVYVRQ